MKQTHYFYITLAVLVSIALGQQASAQTAVGIGSTVFTPDANSVLDVRSTTTGVLLPRMTADPTTAGNNDDGLIYFNTTSQTYRYFNESANAWTSLLNDGGANFINNQTTLQPTSNFNISGAGIIGTTLDVGTFATVGTTLRVGNGIIVGALGTPGNILMSVDDSWIGTGTGINDSRIEFDQTADDNIKIYPRKKLYIEVNDDGLSETNQVGLELKHAISARGAGIKLSGTRNQANDEIGFIDFENNDSGLATLGRVSVKNSSANNTNGSFHISLQSSSSSTLNERLVLDNLGNMEIDGKFTSNGIKETSDGRFKKNIAGISNALSTVLNLEGVTYSWRTEEFPERSFTDRTEYGVIAQQIEKIVPELVDTDEKGYKSVQYSHMVPLLIEAIKEQQLIINSQIQEIGVLKASVDAISEHIKTAKK